MSSIIAAGSICRRKIHDEIAKWIDEKIATRRGGFRLFDLQPFGQGIVNENSCAGIIFARIHCIGSRLAAQQNAAQSVPVVAER